MTNGVKVNLVYHFYCKSVEDIRVGCGNVYNEINRRCLEHFHDVFDTATFCVCVDDQGDSELIQKAIEWIWSCGFKENVTIKVKPNSPYRDAQTFYDEVVNHLSEFDGMVFFGHNKGNTRAENCDGQKQWIVFSYYSILDSIEKHLATLSDTAMAQVYLPKLVNGYYVPSDIKWMAPGTYTLLNPQKVLMYIKETGGNIPKLTDRFSAESFIPNIIDMTEKNKFNMAICFDECWNTWYTNTEADYYNMNHLEILTFFLSPDRVEEYRVFYDTVMGKVLR